jgi:cbb3-type cytochrome oxidase maturation protein
MSSLAILIPISLVLIGIAVWAFFWATDSGQFDDLDSPAMQAVLDDEPQPGLDRDPAVEPPDPPDAKPPP